jgi:histidine ammonia-lyase
MIDSSLLSIGPKGLTLSQFISVVNDGQRVELSQSPEDRALWQAGCDILKSMYRRGETVYGVTTGYGESCSVEIQGEGIEKLPLFLARFHGCGLGENFSNQQCRAILLARLTSLAKGYSAIRPEVLERMVDFLNLDMAPRIPQEGSVGASGDLTPLSYIAATIMGEREIYVKGKIEPVLEIYQQLKWEPLKLLPKETLGIMNGTSAMTGVAALCYHAAEHLARLCCRITAIGLLGLRGNKEHFTKALFDLKPYPGQSQAATWIREDLTLSNPDYLKPIRVQERYSYRCAPHVVGVLLDALPWMKNHIELELNSVNDNPVIDPENEQVYHGGHFYGGHMAFAMDSLKNLVANQADLLDRQVAILVNHRSNNGLSPNLSGATGKLSSIHHGLKAVQIGVSSFTAEALKLTMPASVFSRSTECHNQDKVSMGTHSARDCCRIIELVQQVAACSIFTSVQALELRVRRGEFKMEWLNADLRSTIEKVQHLAPFLEEDRALESDLRALQKAISRHEI